MTINNKLRGLESSGDVKLWWSDVIVLFRERLPHTRTLGFTLVVRLSLTYVDQWNDLGFCRFACLVALDTSKYFMYFKQHSSHCVLTERWTGWSRCGCSWWRPVFSCFKDSLDIANALIHFGY